MEYKIQELYNTLSVLQNEVDRLKDFIDKVESANLSDEEFDCALSWYRHTHLSADEIFKRMYEEDT